MWVVDWIEVVSSSVFALGVLASRYSQFVFVVFSRCCDEDELNLQLVEWAEVLLVEQCWGQCSSQRLVVVVVLVVQPCDLFQCSHHPCYPRGHCICCFCVVFPECSSFSLAHVRAEAES